MRERATGLQRPRFLPAYAYSGSTAMFLFFFSCLLRADGLSGLADADTRSIWVLVLGWVSGFCYILLVCAPMYRPQGHEIGKTSQAFVLLFLLPDPLCVRRPYEQWRNIPVSFTAPPPPLLVDRYITHRPSSRHGSTADGIEFAMTMARVVCRMMRPIPSVRKTDQRDGGLVIVSENPPPSRSST